MTSNPQRPKGQMRARKHRKDASCGKRRFKDRISAQLSLVTIAKVDTGARDTIPVRAYYHGACRGWHLTSSKYAKNYESTERIRNKK